MPILSIRSSYLNLPSSHNRRDITIDIPLDEINLDLAIGFEPPEVFDFEAQLKKLGIDIRKNGKPTQLVQELTRCFEEGGNTIRTDSSTAKEWLNIAKYLARRSEKELQGFSLIILEELSSLSLLKGD